MRIGPINVYPATFVGSFVLQAVVPTARSRSNIRRVDELSKYLCMNTFVRRLHVKKTTRWSYICDEKSLVNYAQDQCGRTMNVSPLTDVLGPSDLQTALHMERVMRQTKQSLDWLIRVKLTNEGSGYFSWRNGPSLRSVIIYQLMREL